MKEFRDRFIKLSNDRQTRHNLLKKMEVLEKQKVIHAIEIESMHRELLEEQHDVDKLEKITWASVVNTILNSKVEKLEKEKHELYVAQLKYENLKEEYNRIIHEYDRLKVEANQYDMVEDEYLSLLEDITKYIVKEDLEEAQQLQDLMKQRYDFEQERISLNEALIEGEEVQKKLNEAKRYLVKAKDWGEYDLSGGGLVATMKKYHYLDEAQELLTNAQWGLRKFHSALNLLGHHDDKEIESFLTIADYWIDGIFIDYSIQSAIGKLLDSIDGLIIEILNIDENLRKEVQNSLNKKEAMQLSLDAFFDRVSKEE